MRPHQGANPHIEAPACRWTIQSRRPRSIITASGNGITIGPVLLGTAAPVHIMTPSTTVRRLVNMSALTVVDANAVRRDVPG